MQLRTITCIDPKGSEQPSYTSALRNYFIDEETNRLCLVTAEWEIVPPPANFPQQCSDNNECGMFVCKYCKLIAENLPLNFTILDLSRMEIGMEIIHCHINSSMTQFEYPAGFPAQPIKTDLLKPNENSELILRIMTIMIPTKSSSDSQKSPCSAIRHGTSIQVNTSMDSTRHSTIPRTAIY